MLKKLEKDDVAPLQRQGQRIRTVYPAIFAGLAVIVFWSIALDACSAAAQSKKTILRLHGSNTIGAKLAPDLAKAFLTKMGAVSVNQVTLVPNTEINIEGTFPKQELIQVIEIKAHGSTTGFQGLEQGQCDIGMASRKIKDKEVKKLSFLGEMTGLASEHVLALDGVAVIVNAANPVASNIDVVTLRDIFCGKITDWSELDGKPGKINLYARDEASGTHDTFKSLVFGKECSLSSSAARFDSNTELSQAVDRDANGIGYTGLPYVASNKVLGVSDSGMGIRPNVFTVSTEDYPLTRRLHFYTPANPDNQYTRGFVSFALEKEGQEYVKKHNFVELMVSTQGGPPEDFGQPHNEAVLERYLNSIQRAERLSSNIRFKNPQNELDSKAFYDLEHRIVDFLWDNKLPQIILAGFSDSEGDYWQNHKLSCDRAKSVQRELTSRGIQVHEVVCAGEEAPVASNETALGREKNRRVEIWIRR
jgi:phosphate transport system substrate-binding protein